jgi:hypothetical protein
VRQMTALPFETRSHDRVLPITVPPASVRAAFASCQPPPAAAPPSRMAAPPVLLPVTPSDTAATGPTRAGGAAATGEAATSGAAATPVAARSGAAAAVGGEFQTTGEKRSKRYSHIQ